MASPAADRTYLGSSRGVGIGNLARGDLPKWRSVQSRPFC